LSAPGGNFDHPPIAVNDANRSDSVQRRLGSTAELPRGT